MADVRPSVCALGNLSVNLYLFLCSLRHIVYGNSVVCFMILMSELQVIISEKCFISVCI
jgi:hypothetical protein